MKRWDQRPFEIRNLFNPAFCGLILSRALQGYQEEDSDGMPFSLSLLVLPLCLHKNSREIFSDSPRSYLLKTVGNNPQLLVGLAERAEAMLPYTFEAFGLLMETGCFEAAENGRLTMVAGKVKKSITGTDESISCQRVARYIGREFAKTSDRVTIYTTFGVRP